MPIKKKLILILTVVAACVVPVAAYFHFHSPKTLADVVGSQFMEPDQMIILNGSNGKKREVIGKDREDMLKLFQEAEVKETENTDLTNGYIGYVQCIKEDKSFTLITDGSSSFRTNDPENSNKMIVYYLDKEKGKRINDIMERYYKTDTQGVRECL